jgi:hypothetical protein
MTMFYFHVRNGNLFTEDSEGSDLIDNDAALLEARAMARDFAIGDLMQPTNIADRTIEIRDAAGSSLWNFRARDVLDGDHVPAVA